VQTLFPEIKPNESFYLSVDPLHELYVEECGNPEGLPVIFLHGGPGAGFEPANRRFFNPEIYRIILFDQRGAGRSHPHASLVDNTTADLVADMELIRIHLNIDNWVVFGGSWGSTLALVYAQSHPARVLAMILRGIFLCRPQEIQWFYQEGASRLFPDYWQDFLAQIPVDERGDLVGAYFRRLTGEDEIARMAAAKAWSLWEGRCSTLLNDKEKYQRFSSPHVALSLARIEAHYFINNSFLSLNQILRDAYRLADIPGIIVHGRYDVVCPIENAFQLQKAWPRSQLRVIPDCGHSAAESGITDALVKSTAEIAGLLTRGKTL
jgi:proline iminopeptidase